MVAKIDAIANEGLTKRFEVKGFPTIFMISEGKLYPFSGERDADGFVKFAKGGFKGLKYQKVPHKWTMWDVVAGVCVRAIPSKRCHAL